MSNANSTRKVLIATGKMHDQYTECTPEYLADNYDYQYFSSFMEPWARDCVSNYVGTDDDSLAEFVKEYLKIAHHDLIVDDI